MKNKLSFFLVVRYFSSTDERLFLDNNWGIKDVRGVYLMNSFGDINVDKKFLSLSFPSTVSLVISLSNRCPIPAVPLEISTSDKKLLINVKKNSSSDAIIYPVLATEKMFFTIRVHLPNIINKDAVKEFVDVISIDELTIERTA